MEMLLLGLDGVIGLHDLQTCKRISWRKVLHINVRTRHVCSIQFNINSISDNQCLKDLSFKKAEVGRNIDMIVWSCIKKRNKYRYDEATTTYLFMQRLACTVRWSNVELRYWMFASQIYKVFW